MKNHKFTFKGGDLLFDMSQGGCDELIVHFVHPYDILKRRSANVDEGLDKIKIPKLRDDDLKLSNPTTAKLFKTHLITIRNVLGDSSH